MSSPIEQNIWWDISPISAGVFGVPCCFAVIVLVSLLPRRSSPEVPELVKQVRYLKLDEN